MLSFLYMFTFHLLLKVHIVALSQHTKVSACDLDLIENMEKIQRPFHLLLICSRFLQDSIFLNLHQSPFVLAKVEVLTQTGKYIFKYCNDHCYTGRFVSESGQNANGPHTQLRSQVLLSVKLHRSYSSTEKF